MTQIEIRLLARIYDDSELLYYVRNNLRNSEEIDSFWRIHCSDFEGLKPEFKKLVEKANNGTLNNKFKELENALGFLVKECTDKFGYFFSPKDSKDSAKMFWESSKYDLDKSVKVITSYYREWNNDIKPKGVYSLLVSSEWDSLYNSFKENRTTYKGLK